MRFVWIEFPFGYVEGKTMALPETRTLAPCPLGVASETRTKGFQRAGSAANYDVAYR
jgi:hypothetical protein